MSSRTPLRGADGIDVGDAPFPRWWTACWALTLAFGVGYMVQYHLGGSGLSPVAAYEAATARAGGARWEALLTGDGKIDEAALGGALLEASGDPALLGAAKPLYLKYCQACHGLRGEGRVGPNLTDDYQLHGSTPTDIYRVIRDGIPGKAMIAGRLIMQPHEVLNVTAYVVALRGEEISGGRGAQGRRIVEWHQESGAPMPPRN